MFDAGLWLIGSLKLVRQNLNKLEMSYKQTHTSLTLGNYQAFRLAVRCHPHIPVSYTHEFQCFGSNFD